MSTKNSSVNSFGARDTLEVGDHSYEIYRLDAVPGTEKLPYSLKVLAENLLRTEDGANVTKDHIDAIANWDASADPSIEIQFTPARVVMQDFTGVPCIVDLATMREAVGDLGGDIDKVNPLAPAELVIDHSVIVDVFGSADAFERNVEIEYERNGERYQFLRWGQGAFDDFKVVPPGTGIVHQVNIEYLARTVMVRESDGTKVAYPDTCVGTDSHTTMVNGLGVLGWGVGGIEAEAVMLGQPVYMLAPDVVGFKLTGAMRPGVTATDMTLRIVQMLRKHGVVGKFVEFFGPGMKALSLADRATIANMAPEYGATCGFFPVDERTLDYLRLTGRDEDHVDNVERYYRAQGLFHADDTPEPQFTATLELDLGDVEPALAGPKRPQDRVDLSAMKEHFLGSLTAPVGHSGHGLDATQLTSEAEVEGAEYTLTHGDVVIAAITSCTNTSNPSVMLAAGLLARNAVKRGLTTKPWVKTSLAPGSRVVTEYYDKAGLTDDLEALGFANVGYGCTTCIGNSGPLDPAIEAAIDAGKLIAGSVISGNRNFEGRVHNKVKASYLGSPPLVVAYAIAGTLNIDLDNDPIGVDKDGNEVMLADIWPTAQEIADTIASCIDPAMFRARYSDVTEEPRWDAIPVQLSELYPWDENSTYIQLPTFFQGITPKPEPISSITGARVLLKLGDSVTTDHISPAGSFPADSPAGKYLISKGVQKKDFNSYGSRRGNHEVMMRGTFANVRIRNQLAPGTEGGFTTYFPTGEVETVFDASMKYQQAGTPLVVLAGTQYGTGSSRDWAAKGTLLLGVKAVITKSYERIHRSNLVGMGVLPLCFQDGEDADSLGLDGTETFDIPLGELKPMQVIQVTATKGDGAKTVFDAVVRLDTPVEVEYYKNGGILQTVVRNLAK